MRLMLASFLIVLAMSYFAHTQDTSDDLYVIVDNNKYGYIDRDGNILIKPQFEWGSQFKEGWADIYVCGRVVSMDAKGNLLPHSPARNYTLMPKKVHDKYGFANSSGLMVIPPIYDQVLWFAEGLAPARIGTKWGFINERGETVIPYKYADARVFHEGVAIIRVGGTLQIDANGQKTISRGSEGIIDQKGRVLAKGFDSINESSQGRLRVEINDLFGYVDTFGHIKAAIAYEDARWFSEGLAAVKKGGKWGYVNRDGKITIPFLYDDIVAFSEGLAAVQKQGKWGYINE